ncbi:DUF4013 domain-containing protein [Natronococcus sp. JC468]|uniref:DUF4013 domain-containing protein n=1 Tax=Natronococcus sp. JC468 TaxID=1961921 RepID=UPI001439825E|nr:DUF4013 domain-containing protein [Natronococcus sp. JC468]NKE34917.1 DUF4013 domain-containing protein [Natronococcus sp. JC468]
MLADALEYPSRGAPTVGVAGIVVAIAVGCRYVVEFVPSIVAVLPGAATALALAVLVGYLSRVLVDEGRAPPRLEVGPSALSGIRSLGIAAVFLAGPVALLLATASSFAEAGAGGSGEIPAAFLVSSTATLFLFLACAYALPAAAAAATKTGSVRAAFDRERVAPALGRLPYVTAWTTGFALLGIGLVPISIAIRSGDIAGLLAALFGAYLVLAGSRVVATGYRRATTAGNTTPIDA